MKTLSMVLVYSMLWLIQSGAPEESWDDMAITNQREIVEVINA